MKQSLLLIIFSLFLFSCQDNLLNIEEQSLEDSDITLRGLDEDCRQSFTPGNVWGNLFGEFPFDRFDDTDWNGTFEQEFFPCPPAQELGDCCNESVIVDFDVIDPLPFKTICNEDLDSLELQDLADVVWSLATEHLPECDGITLNPVSINIIMAVLTCCDFDSPCPWLENDCDCYDLYPDNPYWGCCENYRLKFQVKYARTTPCGPKLCC